MERKTACNESLPFVWLDVRQVISSCPFRSRTVLYAKIAAGGWPKPYKFGSRSLWRSDEVASANADYATAALKQRDEMSARATAKAKRAVASRKPAAVA